MCDRQLELKQKMGSKRIPRLGGKDRKQTAWPIQVAEVAMSTFDEEMMALSVMTKLVRTKLMTTMITTNELTPKRRNRPFQRL
jgi:hypothetical protein